MSRSFPEFLLIQNFKPFPPILQNFFIARLQDLESLVAAWIWASSHQERRTI